MNRRQHIKLMAAGAGSLTIPSIAHTAIALANEVHEHKDFSTRAAAFAVAPQLTWLRTGDVLPEGWLKEQMLRDLHTGFAGCLNELCTEAAQDIFAAGRNTIDHHHAILGNVDTDWWDGETEGNWRTGFLMLAYMSGDKTYQAKADQYVDHILQFQDEDGYLGVYTGTMKYQYPGEIWTQTCLLRGLLAYAELTHRADVLSAVIRAVDAIMHVYGPGGRNLSFAELHDLMIMDVLERLGELTGNPKYGSWGLWMYECWSSYVPPTKTEMDEDNDTTLPALLDPNHAFYGHGVHVAEHARIPLWLSMTTGRKDLRDASLMAIEKLDRYALPGGSTVSMEWMRDKKPDPLMAEYEYCTTKETQHTYLSAMQKTGNTVYADRVERVFLNDAQGSRTADGSAISYLSADNRLHCDGLSADGTEKEPRNKLSPTHADVAVCCCPMATIVSPLYVKSMWMRHLDGGFIAMLYGPCAVNTEVNGTSIAIRQVTSFPFEQTVRMELHPARAVWFSLYLRNPGWSAKTTIQCAGAHIERKGGYWRVTKRWHPGDTVAIDFTSSIQEHEAVNGEKSFSYGPLVYAAPLKARQTSVKKYDISVFADTYLQPAGAKDVSLAVLSRTNSVYQTFHVVTAAGNKLRPFDSPLIKLVGTMMDIQSKEITQIELVPLGNANGLRRVTFPVVE